MQARRKRQFCFVLTLSPRLYAFLNKGMFDSRLKEKWREFLTNRVAYLLQNQSLFNTQIKTAQPYCTITENPLS